MIKCNLFLPHFASFQGGPRGGIITYTTPPHPIHPIFFSRFFVFLLRLEFFNFFIFFFHCPSRLLHVPGRIVLFGGLRVESILWGRILILAEFRGLGGGFVVLCVDVRNAWDFRGTVRMGVMGSVGDVRIGVKCCRIRLEFGIKYIFFISFYLFLFASFSFSFLI